MKYWEVIYENGEHSIMSVEDEGEALAALEVQHERAKAGLPGGPTGHPATRISRVLEYSQHPSEYGSNQNVSADEAKSRFADALKNATVDGVVNIGELESQMRELIYPMVDSEPHDSNYKMKEDREVKLAWL